MGAIARNIANNITTAGVFTSSAIANSSVTGITVLANASDGITLISSQTASASASLSFTTGINSTYKAYKFVFVNMHPASDDPNFSFQTSTNGGSSYGVTLTSTLHRAYHKENDTLTGLDYYGVSDLAQSTAFQNISDGAGNENDSGYSGSMVLFNPSSTTYVKHFICSANSVYSESPSNEMLAISFPAGYFNTTSAINAIQFKFSAGNIDAGTIYMYGIK